MDTSKTNMRMIYMNKLDRHSILMIFLWLLLLVGCQSVSSLDALERDNIVVEILGEVAMPGSYELPKKATLKELLAIAGGITELADVSGLNLNQLLHHNDVLHIEQFKQIEKVSINTANMEQLQALPGIGPTTAAAIVAYRETKGFFQTIDGLLEIKGIGPKKLAKLRDFAKL